MALRDVRGAGLRRALGGRAGVVALACALYLAAGLLAVGRDLTRVGDEFLAYGRPRPAAVSPGDHLQTSYNLWLPGHQLVNGRAPWRDPYSFQPEAAERTNFAGWPFGLVFGPLHALLGTVGAWNVFVLLTYVGAGGFAALWLRSLGLPLGASLVGGFAFTLAPYRSAQTAGGHLLGPVSMLLPLTLWALETRRVSLAAAALASIPLSGQVHLALGAIPFVLAYAWARGRLRPGLVAAGLATAAGLLVYTVAIRGTTAGEGRSFAEVERYSAELLDFGSRHVRHGFESFVFIGWLLPVLALAGLVVLVRRHELGLAVLLGGGVLVPSVLALGAGTPVYEPLWRVLPGLRQTRVPERLLPIACLCLAALAAFAIARVRLRFVAVAALVLLAIDLGVDLYRPMGADEHNAVYAALSRQPPGRLLERPVYLPDVFEGNVYLYYAIQARRERPLSYSTTAPRAADVLARRLRRAPRDDAVLRTLGVRYVVLYGRRGPVGYRLVG